MTKQQEDYLAAVGESLWDVWVKPCYDEFFKTHDINRKAHCDKFNKMMNDIMRRHGSWNEDGHEW